jgi:putative flippase GtrA
MILKISNKKIYEFIRFGTVGVVNTVLDLAVLNFLVYIFSVENSLIFSICKGISFIVAVINSYFMNKYFTFTKKETTNKSFYLFVIISLVGLVVNIVISSVSFYFLKLYPGAISINLIATVSGIIGALFSTFINYFSYSYFVFK